MTFGEYTFTPCLILFLSCPRTLSHLIPRNTRDHKHISALTMDPTRHTHMAVRRSQVPGVKARMISESSSGFLKIDPVRNATNAPSSVRMICALESAFLYQSMT